jgi:polyhydroxybutyrate depolymerase
LSFQFHINFLRDISHTKISFNDLYYFKEKTMLTINKTLWRKLVLSLFCVIILSAIYRTNLFASTQSRVSINVNGSTRTYELFIPTGYKAATPAPLVIDLHPFFGWGTLEADSSGFRALAEANNFICAWPNGEWFSWNAGNCCGYAIESNIDDVAFILAVVNNIKAGYNVNCSKVYAVGYSNGGDLAERLAVEATNTFAAVASYGSALETNIPYAPSRPVSVILFRGINDTHINYNGGGYTTDWTEADNQIWRRGAYEDFNNWKAANSCTGSPDLTYTNGLNKCETYQNCAGGVKVALCSLNCDHGNYYTNGGPDGTPVAALAWNFLKQFSEPNGGTCGKPASGGGGGGCGVSEGIAGNENIVLPFLALSLFVSLFAIGIWTRKRRSML